MLAPGICLGDPGLTNIAMRPAGSMSQLIDLQIEREVESPKGSRDAVGDEKKERKRENGEEKWEERRRGRRGERVVSQRRGQAHSLQTSLGRGQFPSRPIFLRQGMSFPLLEECKMCSG